MSVAIGVGALWIGCVGLALPIADTRRNLTLPSTLLLLAGGPVGLLAAILLPYNRREPTLDRAAMHLCRACEQPIRNAAPDCRYCGDQGA